MNKNKYTFMRGLTSKISLVLLFALIGIVNAVAENTLNVDNFSIKPGETKLVAVNLNNTDKITSLQADFTLPSGLQCSTDLTTNTDRLDREEQTASLTEQKTTNGESTNIFRLVIFAQSLDSNPIKGSSGVIVYLKITAAKDFNTKSIINVTTVHGSDANSNDLPMASSATEVTPQVATIATTDIFSIRPDSTLKKIDVLLNNDVDIYGLQADVTLPEGMSIENKANSTRYKFIYADRLPSDATVNATNLSNGKIRLILSALSHTAIANNSGVIFSFNVKADKNLAEVSNIVFDNVIVSDTNDVAYEIGQTNKIIVTNTYLAQYVPVVAKFNASKAIYEAAGTKIAKDYADVVKDSAIVVQGNKIGSLISTAHTAIERAYAKDSLANDSVSIISKMEQIQVEVSKWVTNAAVAEKAFVDAKEKKEVNEAVNTKLTAAIKSVQGKLDAAKDTVSTKCKDVVDQFVSIEKGIQAKIDSITDVVKAKYKAVELTAVTTVDTVSIETAIIKMVTDATAAEKTFTENEAKKVVNEAANTKLTAAIKSVQGKLDAAKDTVSTKCKDVVDQFVSIEKGIQAKIDSITASVKAKYEAVELTTESTVDTVSIETAITKMVTDATAAEKVFTDNEAKEAANEAAYAKLTDQISSVQINLQATKIALAASCADVVSQFADRMVGIQTRIDKMKDSLKVQYDAVALTAESTVNVADIETAISELIADATAAEKAFTENEAKKEANEAANTKLTAVIALVQEKLDAAKDTVTTKCKDVVDQFVSVEKEIQTKIDSITDVVKAKYKAVELTAESVINTVDIETAISKLIIDAKKAQRDYDIYTGINPILDSDANVQIFSISGQHLTAPVKGTVNIIRFSNGQTKKIFVK